LSLPISITVKFQLSAKISITVIEISLESSILRRKLETNTNLHGRDGRHHSPLSQLIDGFIFSFQVTLTF